MAHGREEEGAPRQLPAAQLQLQLVSMVSLASNLATSAYDQDQPGRIRNPKQNQQHQKDKFDGVLRVAELFELVKPNSIKVVGNNNFV